MASTPVTKGNFFVRGDNPRRNKLRQTAADTKSTLPQFLAQYRTFNAQASTLYNLPSQIPTTPTPPNTLSSLNPSKCPGYRFFTVADTSDSYNKSSYGTRIRVVNGDTLDTARTLQRAPTVSAITKGSHDANSTGALQTPVPKPVLILNLASQTHAGGGWQNGALAQEEELCYRTSLSVSLHHHYYPIPALSAIYSPNVILLRESYAKDHAWALQQPADMPVYSVVSVAGLRDPEPEYIRGEHRYKNGVDREMTRDKIRLVLRIAAEEGHTKLVLGALGCGVFHNPPEEVARCFREVFEEPEFQMGWWEDVVFAVMDNASGSQSGEDSPGNYGIFHRALDGYTA
jgi:uncharacterized protein (TIGR02452 family)